VLTAVEDMDRVMVMMAVDKALGIIIEYKAQGIIIRHKAPVIMIRNKALGMIIGRIRVLVSIMKPMRTLKAAKSAAYCPAFSCFQAAFAVFFLSQRWPMRESKSSSCQTGANFQSMLNFLAFRPLHCIFLFT
jgi:hypothetical protein